MQIQRRHALPHLTEIHSRHCNLDRSSNRTSPFVPHLIVRTPLTTKPLAQHLLPALPGPQRRALRPIVLHPKAPSHAPPRRPPRSLR